MAIKPSPTIAGKLRKLFSNNKQTIEPAIGDSIPGGSGGGANVLTLYMGAHGGDQWAYKNPEHTEEYQSCEEAETALANADVVILRVNENPVNKVIPVSTASVSQSVFVSFFTAGGTATMVYLYKPGPQ